MSKGRRRRILWCLHCNHDRSSPRGRSVHQMGASQSQLNAPLKRYTWCLQRHAYRCIRLLQRQIYNARTLKFSTKNARALWNLPAARPLLVTRSKHEYRAPNRLKNIAAGAPRVKQDFRTSSAGDCSFDLKLGSQIYICVRPLS